MYQREIKENRGWKTIRDIARKEKMTSQLLNYYIKQGFIDPPTHCLTESGETSKRRYYTREEGAEVLRKIKKLRNRRLCELRK